MKVLSPVSTAGKLGERALAVGSLRKLACRSERTGWRVVAATRIFRERMWVFPEAKIRQRGAAVSIWRIPSTDRGS